MKSFHALLCLVLMVQVYALTRPPSITQQPDFNVFYKALETVEMICEGEGYPRPVYSWKRNGVNFVVGGNDDRVVQLANVGTIVFTKPEDKDEGMFQCFATNEYGVALSIKINLREAKLLDFEVGGVTTVRPVVGQRLTLNCVPPESIPPPFVYWVIRKRDGSQDAVNVNARVTIDLEHRLRFTNVLKSDAMNGMAYSCMAMNSLMRKLTQGHPYVIEPQGTNPEMHPVEYMWASPEDHFGLLGSNFTLKCIFSGYPTPDVYWDKTGEASLPERFKFKSFGQELMIEKLQFEDAGTYECWATNTLSNTRVQRTFSIRVESTPYWLLEPQDVEIGVGGTAEFDCLAKAAPEPQYYWFINGVSLEDVQDPRITPERFKRPRPDRIVFSQLTRDDSMVIQCNATNKHGYIWGDVYLNVLSEEPTILTPPAPRNLAAEGTSVTLTCRVTGKPDPIITWYKDEQQITGGRYRIMPTGDLYIENVVLSDAGLYLCEAQGTTTSVFESGVLLVRRKTRIEQAPMDLEVNAGTDAKFTCSATTDPEEVLNLRIKWLKDNKEISTAVQRMTTNIQDNSLTISGTIDRDSGTYTCIATNGLDQTAASAMLTVKDRPDPATRVRLMNCEKHAIIEWMPGSYNNAPVQYYTVQYNTTFNADTWNFAIKVDPQYNKANITLSPWVNYTFRVIAYNKIGDSQPSTHTKTVCTTEDAVPDGNPQNLRTIGDRKDYLHIEWTPMPQIQQNGKGFQYILQIHRKHETNNVKPIPLDDWRQYEYFFPAGGQTYQPYNISLQARNSVGFARQDATVIEGYTGEAIPQVTIMNAGWYEVGETSAVLTWEMDASQINGSTTQLNGEFRGFKIQFWQQGFRDVTLREWNVSPEEALASMVGNKFTATVGDLLPLTTMDANVAVMNNYFLSKPSDMFTFTTKAGFPGPVELFRPINIGDNHVNLEWKPPEENRGNILGYDIGYQTVKGLDLGEMQERDPQIVDPYATTAMLSGLLTHTRYRIHIWARTLLGRGEGYFIEVVTSKAGDPQAPRFTISNVGRHNINITWWLNPYATSGTVVYVEYRKEDAAEWLRTTDEVISSYKNITDLESGTTYEIRVISTNGGSTKASYIEEVTTDGIATASALVGNWGWFLGMMLAMVLLIGLIIFFVILFKRGTRFKQRESPSNSFYGGDAATYSGTYADNTSRIPKRSADFGEEPRGFSNDYYDERDRGYYADNKDKAGYYDNDRKDYDDRRDNNDYDRRDYGDSDKRDYGDSDKRDYDDRRDNSRDYDDRRDNSRDYDDRRNHDDRRNDRDNRSGDRDRRSYDEDRYRPPSYNDVGHRYPDTREEPYEDYNRKPSGSSEPDVDKRDYREPSRFDRHGAPIDSNHDRPSSQEGGGGASSTFV